MAKPNTFNRTTGKDGKSVWIYTNRHGIEEVLVTMPGKYGAEDGKVYFIATDELDGVPVVAPTAGGIVAAMGHMVCFQQLWPEHERYSLDFPGWIEKTAGVGTKLEARLLAENCGLNWMLNATDRRGRRRW